jgi:hypothetical protein
MSCVVEHAGDGAKAKGGKGVEKLVRGAHRPWRVANDGVQTR